MVNIYKPSGASVKTMSREVMATQKREDKNTLLSFFCLDAEKWEMYLKI